MIGLIGQSVQLNVEEEPRLGPGPAQTLLLLTEELTVLETAVNPETAILMRFKVLSIFLMFLLVYPCRNP